MVINNTREITGVMYWFIQSHWDAIKNQISFLNTGTVAA